MSVARAQREVSSAEFVEWIAYDREHPIGDERMDLGFGIVASTIAKVHGNRREPRDFMPLVNKPKPTKVMTTSEIRSVLNRLVGTKRKRGPAK